jgi:hypothetical protein
MLKDYARTKPNENERTFNFFVKKDSSVKHYTFGLWYHNGRGSGSGTGYSTELDRLLANELTNLELSKVSSNSKPIKVKFYGDIFKDDSFSLEPLLRIYARSENVPIDFEYLPAIRRK